MDIISFKEYAASIFRQTMSQPRKYNLNKQGYEEPSKFLLVICYRCSRLSARRKGTELLGWGVAAIFTVHGSCHKQICFDYQSFRSFLILRTDCIVCVFRLTKYGGRNGHFKKLMLL